MIMNLLTILKYYNQLFKKQVLKDMLMYKN